jgi:hypothetical protein
MQFLARLSSNQLLKIMSFFIHSLYEINYEVANKSNQSSLIQYLKLYY